ncbi:hypothetical protein SDC9_08917 [bioreactor metagenome]|uniref:Uncharacterized protein n=1 Tax=bioreactor metagenome TaxID=1076179 RepID=A0A644T8L9_9ZZZZ|nr:hypothetical protein [Negativicutes bacterium]
MDRSYDATYYSKIGKAVVHVVAPSPMSSDEFEKRLREFHHTAWVVWNSLSVEERLKLNNEHGVR